MARKRAGGIYKPPDPCTQKFGEFDCCYSRFEVLVLPDILGRLRLNIVGGIREDRDLRRVKGGPSTADDWDCDLSKKLNIFSKPTLQDIQHTFTFCGVVPLLLTAHPRLRILEVQVVLGEEFGTVTIACPCLVLC